MRLYYNGNSKNKIGYTVDSITIEGPDGSFQYDLRGEQDYEPNDFSGRFKGSIYKFVFTDENGEEIDFDEEEELTEEDEEDFFRMLEDDNYDKILCIFPYLIDDEDELFWDFVDDDEITDVEATVEIGRREATFKCTTECLREG